MVVNSHRHRQHLERANNISPNAMAFGFSTLPSTGPTEEYEGTNDISAQMKPDLDLDDDEFSFKDASEQPVNKLDPDDNSIRLPTPSVGSQAGSGKKRNLQVNKSSTLPSLMNNKSSSGTARLTMLEPDDSAISSINNRETILSQAAHLNPFDSIGSRSNNYTQDNPDEKILNPSSSGQMLFLAASSVLFLLLGLLLIYRWFYKSRSHSFAGNKKREVRNAGGRGDKSALCDEYGSPNSMAADQFLNSSPSKDLRKRAGNSYSASEQDTMVTYVAGNNSGRPYINFATSREQQIPLVERKGLAGEANKSRHLATNEQDDADVIQSIGIDDEVPQEPEQSVKSIHEKIPISTMVTLKRRVNKSSLFVAAKSSARPKVRLISDRVRKFIDDEAEEMKAKSAQRILEGKKPTLANKVLAYLLTRNAPTNLDKATDEHGDEGQSIPLVVRVEVERGKEDIELEAAVIEQQESCDRLKETTPVPDSAKSVIGQLMPNSGLTSDDNPNLKLSPSPVLHVANGDACSSNLSGCSLFSPSPMHESAVSQPCHCTAHLGGGILPQCQSPYPLSAEIGNRVESPIAVYRPCCSASPSALIAGKQDVYQLDQRVTTFCYQQPQKALRVNSAGHWPHYINKSHGEMVLAGRSSESRIKRQYENYYDDEQEDTYRRLTASFGVDLGFGLHHGNTCGSHHMPNSSLNQTTNPFTTVHSYNFNQNQRQQNLTCRCCTNNHQRLAQPVVNHDHHSVSGPSLHPPLESSPYLFKSGNASAGGSAGELISTSASTSLGGSDSGFAVNTHNISYNQPNQPCRDPLCACRISSSPTPIIPQSTPIPPMSILVQQPSFATPPPPQQQSPEPAAAITSANQPEKHQQQQQQENLPPQGQISSTDATTRKLSHDSSATAALSPLIKSCDGRSKWKQRRKLSQRVHTDMFCSQSGGYRHCSSDRRPRRMSIAGDQVASHRTKLTTGASISSAQHNCLTSYPSASQHLQHRASIASTFVDSNWQRQQKSPVTTATNQFQKATPFQCLPGHSYPLHHNQTEPALFTAGSSVSRAHRPSDASLYEAQSYSSNGPALLNGKSSYSSSTSSGIGVSGSTCTNTPTACAFPYGSFATCGPQELSNRFPFEMTAGNSSMSQTATNVQGESLTSHRGYQWLPPQCSPMLYNLSHGVAEGAARAALDGFGQVRLREGSPGPSRKYSLPVQLESHVAERVSPSRTRLLFEKNLHRVDSSKTNQQQQQQYQYQLQQDTQIRQNQNQNSVSSWRQVEARAKGTRPTLADSRRSSQTITRQSSFWLDEDNDNCNNVVDSMLSISMAGPSTSYNEQVIDQCKPVSNSQRPSLGSLVLSGDSIESVKQRPMIAKPVQASTDDTTSTNMPPSVANESTDTKPVAGPTSSLQRHMRNRLSSSTSTSSAASSPSPDFSRPSERILALASKSGSISKRHLMSKLHRKVPKRLPRLGSTTSSSSSSSSSSSGGSTNSDPITSIKKLPPFMHASNRSLISKREPSEDADTECGPEENQSDSQTGQQETPTTKSIAHDSDGPAVDGGLTVEPVARPIADLSSASLERQCRDLWKLRATLHNDSCTSDNWTNYHQRLNRRYDSGYKSVENQLSSSLENNIAAAAAGSGIPRESSSTSQTQTAASSAKTKDDQVESCVDLKLQETDEDKGVSSMDIQTPSDNTPVNEPAQNDSLGIDGKLAELELDDIDVECLVAGSRTPERECQSRTSSKGSSGEDDQK